MAFALCFEDLEVEKVKAQEKEALKDGPEVAEAQQDKAVEDALVTISADQDAEDDDSSSMDGNSSGESTDPETDPSTDEGENADPSSGTDADPVSDDDESDPPEDEDKPDDEEKKKDEDETKQAQESLRRFDGTVVVFEDYHDYETGAAAGEIVASGLSQGYKAASWVVSGIASLGMEYGPTILKAVGKGVLFTIAKLAQGLSTMYDALAKAAAKRQASIAHIQKAIEDLKHALQMVKERGKRSTPSEGSFDKTEAIDNFKIGIKADTVVSINVLNEFMNKAALQIAEGALADLKGLSRLQEHIGDVKDSDIVSALEIGMSRSGFTHANISGDKVDSFAVEQLVYDQALPGDVVFHVVLPVSKLRNVEEFEKAYNESDIELHFDKENYRRISDLPILRIDQVEKTIVALEGVLKTLQNQDKLFKEIEDSKPGVLTTVKSHLGKLAKMASPVDLSASMAEPMYLKSKFVSSVYLDGLIQTQIYAAKTIHAVIRYCTFSLSHY